MRRQNRKPNKNNRRRSKKANLNQQIRQLCCWNCFQQGHLRFQCPFPKVEVCSFCRKPGIRSSNCSCDAARQHFNVSVQPDQNDKIAQMNSIALSYQENVLVPVNAHEENPQFEERDNIVIFLENHQSDEDEMITELYDEDDTDVLDLYAEEDDLSKL